MQRRKERRQMRRVNYLFLLLTLFIPSVHCFCQNRQRRQVTVITNEDKKYKGQFSKADESNVVIESDDGQTTIKLDRVKLIMFGDISENSTPLLSSRTTKSSNQTVEAFGLTFES